MLSSFGALSFCVCVQESAVVVDQLRRDKEELLNRVVSLQQQQEAGMTNNQRLCKKVSTFSPQPSPNLLVMV